jgi:hypothetical protein
MPSPFPGMDPYIEDPAFWQDFHRRWITYCADALNERLPNDYEARVDEQIRLIEYTADERRIAIPDVAVAHGAESPRFNPTRQPSGDVAILEPMSIPMPVVEEVRDVWIEILHRPERSLITIIELLSPSNKMGSGLGEYRAKRRAILQQPVHLVEFDLLIGGSRLQLRHALPNGDYYAFITRWDRRPNVDVYFWSLRQPLPSIPIPLRSPNQNVLLDLGQLAAQVYDRGRYRNSLRYDRPPTAPLSADDAQWAIELAQSASK